MALSVDKEGMGDGGWRTFKGYGVKNERVNYINYIKEVSREGVDKFIVMEGMGKGSN